MRSTLIALTICIAVPSFDSSADTIAFPTSWGLREGESCVWDGRQCAGYALAGSPTTGIDIPHDIAVQLVQKPGWGIKIATARIGVGNIPSAYNKHVTVLEGFMDVWGANGSMYAIYNGFPNGQPPAELCLWASTRNNNVGWDGPIQWVGPCVPITWGQVPTSCAVVGPDVMLDHGTVKVGAVSVTSTTAEVSCTGNASGHLALPKGGDTIPVGVGYSKLTTDIGALSSTRPFAKGNTPIELTSSLHDVEPGTWTASATIVVVLD